MAQSFSNTIKKYSGEGKRDLPPLLPAKPGVSLIGLVSIKNATSVNKYNNMPQDIIKFLFRTPEGTVASLKTTAIISGDRAKNQSQLTRTLRALSGNEFSPSKADEAGAFSFLNSCIDRWFKAEITATEWFLPDGSKANWSWVDIDTLRPVPREEAPSMPPRAYFKALQDQKEGKGGDLPADIFAPTLPEPTYNDDEIPF